MSSGTDFISLTELWKDGKYNAVGDQLNRWPPAKIVEFCNYFMKYVGSRDLAVLYKFL